MKCKTCPVRSGLPCLGERHPPVCLDVAGGMPGRSRQLVQLAEHQPEPEPGLLEMAGNLIKAVAGHVATGLRTTSPEVQARRLAICRSCPFFEPTMPACKKCGCGTVVKGGLETKISWASEQCPLEPPRWGPV